MPRLARVRFFGVRFMHHEIQAGLTTLRADRHEESEMMVTMPEQNQAIPTSP